MRANDGRVSSVAKVVFDVITNYILVIQISASNIQLVLNTVMIINARDYPTTILPGTTINAPNTALLDTIETLNGVVHCIQQNYLTRIRAIRSGQGIRLLVVTEESEDDQVCEIEVKQMYIAVERKVSELLQELLRQNELYFGSLYDGFSKNSTYTPPLNVGITRASDVCFAVTGWLKRHLDYVKHVLDGGNLEQYISYSLRNGSFLDKAE